MFTAATKLSLCILGVFSVVSFASEESPGIVAEFVMSEKLIEQFSITGKKTAPFQHHGLTMHPKLDLNVGIKLQNSDNGIAAQLGVGLNGQTTTHSSRRVGPFQGHQVNVTVQNQLQANYTQDILLNQGGLNAGTPKGSPVITPQISTSNDFKLLNRKVNGIAYSTASQMTAQIIPKDKAELNNQIRTNLNDSVSAAQNFLSNTMNQISEIIKDPESIPYKTAFSSKAGDKGNIKVQFADKKSSSDRSPKPTLPNSEQEATHYMIHEDMFADLIAKDIAGKEMRLSDLKGHLCSEKTKNLLNFCKEELPKGVENLSIIFEKENPVELSFANGKIGMKLNASYRVSLEDKENKSNDLFTDPSQRDVTGRTIPYSIEFSYTVKGNSAKLDSFNVTDRYSDKSSKRGGLFGSLFGGGSHSKSEDAKDDVPVADPAAILFSKAIRQKVYEGFKDVLKDEIEWPIVSVPSKIEVDMNSTTQPTKIKVTDAGSLLPLATQIENGWLASSAYYCSESMPSFGVSYRNSTSGKGIRVSAVNAGSPAGFLGMNVGDTIESISKIGEASSETEANEKTFPEFIRAVASQKDTEERKIVVKGIDKSGQSYSREVILCPSGYPHRENAEKLVESAKKPPIK